MSEAPKTPPEAPEPLDLRSHDLVEEKRRELLSLFPEARTEGGKIDFERLRAALGEAVDVGKERYGLTWPGKAECMRAVQTPSVGTLRPCREESVDFDATENLIIEGDNLEVLKLLQKSYLGKVKMIYIDPPYNTGNDFIYPDDYSESLQTYLEYTGQVDAEGKRFSTNAETDGRFHSKWLSMMWPRLFIARNLMRDDGVIFISIGDAELTNLRRVCDEIFGEENFVACFVWEKRTNRENRKVVSSRHDYIVCYARSTSPERLALRPLPMSSSALARYRNPDNDPRGPWKSDPAHAQAGHGTKAQFYVLRAPNGKEHELPSGRCWLYTQDVMEQEILDGRIWFGQDGNGVPRIKTYLDDKERGLTPESIWFAADASTNENAKTELKELFEGDAVFETPKPIELVQLAMRVCASEGIVLDFFAGAGVTGHAALAMNAEDETRLQFILVQLPEATDRADYPTIAEITKERVRRVIKKLNESEAGQLPLGGTKKQDRGFRVYKLAESNFKPWNADVAHEAEAVAKQLDLHVEHIREGRSPEDLLWEILLKSGFPLTTPIETLTLESKIVYAAAEGEMLVCLDRELTLEAIRAIAERKPSRVVLLDQGFAGNDQLKTNAVQIFRTRGVASFRTV